jgi:phospholipid-binding lipoprotein MlaA
MKISFVTLHIRYFMNLIFCMIALALFQVPALYAQSNPQDPLEGFNRRVFDFNLTLDKHLVEPVASTYVRAVPEPLRNMVGNFFGNIGDIWSATNHLLQGKPGQAFHMVGRVFINTSVGLFGVLDVATVSGVERHSEDFGQTLGVWGVKSGPYIVLPLLGSSTLRDAVAMPLDRSIYNVTLPQESDRRVWFTATQAINGRANALPFTRLLDNVALDKYVFVRDAHLTRRQSLVYDGDVPTTTSDNDEEQAD